MKMTTELKINITIDELLDKKGLTRYWLSKETGMTYQNISNLCSGKTTSIIFEKLVRICNALECEPGDIINVSNLYNKY